jgi:WXG100 family type VII secretion target
MSANIVQAQYETLDTIAARFNARAEATTDMHSHIMRGFEALTQDGWEGKGVAAFSTEMHGEIFPAVQRMTHALQEAQAVTLEAKAILQQAEEEAQRLFGGEETENVANFKKKVSKDLTFTGMKSEDDGKLFITSPKDGRAIHPSDAKQGSLGDCFLATSLAVIAEQDPDVIRKSIRANSDGTYTVTLYEERRGFLGFGESVEPVEITITPDFPTGMRKNANDQFAEVIPHIQPDDQSNGRPELWAMLLEKAYATHIGEGDAIKGYALMEQNGGRTEDVLFALTGQESTSKAPESYSIEELARMEKQGQAITLSSLPKGADVSKKQMYQDGDLVQRHAYYITDVNTETGMVTVQNPWGWDKYTVTVPYNQLNENFRGITVNPLTSR